MSAQFVSQFEGGTINTQFKAFEPMNKAEKFTEK